VFLSTRSVRRQYDMTEAKRQAALSDFMRPKMFRKLARARAIFVGSFSTKLGADENG